MGDNDLSQYDALFASAFPPAEYPILTQLWNENKDNEDPGQILVSETEEFVTDADTSVDVLKEAQSELSERWTDENIEKRVNDTFTDAALAPFFEALNAEQSGAVGDQLRAQIIDVLQNVVAEKKDDLSALVEERLQESLPWYEREWQGLKLMYWAAIGGAVLLLIIILIATGGKKAHSYYQAGRGPPVAPVDPRYAQAGYGGYPY